jgi:hypothetical protein
MMRRWRTNRAKVTRPLSIRVKSHEARLLHGRSKNGYGKHQSLDTLADLARHGRIETTPRTAAVEP